MASSDHSKPSVLIIGGLGYIGRFLALHIHTNGLASEVRLVDKVLPQLAWLAPEFAEACSQEKFVQADASKEQAFPKIFNRSNGKEWDYVFNCGGETRYSQEDEVYKARSLALSVAAGKEAAKRGVKVFVEVSTGMVYKPDSSPRKESDKTKPWLKMAQYKLQAEEELSKIKGLNLVILRLGHVYGPYDTKYIGTSLALARVYQSLSKELKWLWTPTLRVHTVQVNDVARALWAAADWYAKGQAKWDSSKYGSVPIFNIVDHGDTSQGTISKIIGEIFSIETGFQGTVISSFAKLNLDHVVEDVNDESLGPWSELLTNKGISRPGPLTPFMEKELLKDADLSLDGSRFESIVGFTYNNPKITKTEVEKIVTSYKKMNWWP